MNFSSFTRRNCSRAICSRSSLGMPFISSPNETLPSAVRHGKQLGEILEHDAAVHAVAVDLLAADADLAGGRRDEAGDDVEQRGLAAAGRADDADELGGADVEADVLDAGHLAGGRVVDQRNVADFDRGIRYSRYRRADDTIVSAAARKASGQKARAAAIVSKKPQPLRKSAEASQRGG